MIQRIPKRSSKQEQLPDPIDVDRATGSRSDRSLWVSIAGGEINAERKMMGRDRWR
jgi:hypothetical protein